MLEEADEKTHLVPDDYREPSPLDKYVLSWKYLLVAPKDLWLLYVISFFHCSSFFTFVTSLSIYITDVRGFSDSTLSLLFALIGLSGIIYSVLFGNFGDRYGVRFTLILGTGLHTVKYLLLIVFININFAQIVIMAFPGFIGSAMCYPALQSGLKQHASEQCRSLAISCYWSVFYLGSLLGGIILQLFLSFFDKTQDSFMILFVYLLSISLISCILCFFIKDKKPENVTEETRLVVDTTNGWEHTREILILKRFWRLIALVWLLVIIKSVFFHQGIVLPLYMDRDLGDDTYFGSMIILNQVIIIVCTPLLASMVYYLNAYDSFILVGFISVVSPLGFLSGASYGSIISYIVISSIGEGMLSFRIADYALDLAPKGKESVMIAISTIPLVFSIILSGIIGGILMENYCPEDGEKECWKVWGAISLIALPPTVMLILLKDCIEDKKFEANPFVPCSKEAKDY